VVRRWVRGRTAAISGTVPVRSGGGGERDESEWRCSICRQTRRQRGVCAISPAGSPVCHDMRRERRGARGICGGFARAARSAVSRTKADTNWPAERFVSRSARVPDTSGRALRFALTCVRFRPPAARRPPPPAAASRRPPPPAAAPTWTEWPVRPHASLPTSGQAWRVSREPPRQPARSCDRSGPMRSNRSARMRAVAPQIRSSPTT
jgi:hypothetical protein